MVSLFQLPQNAIFKVLTAVDILELFLLSTLSKKSKMLVKSLNFECQISRVQIANDTINLLFSLPDGLSHDILEIDFKYQVPVNRKSDLIVPHYVSFSQKDIREEHPVPRLYRFPDKFGWLHWCMDHVKSTFRFAGVSSLRLFENQFDVQSTWKKFGSNLSNVNISDCVSREDRGIILKTLPISRTLPICKFGRIPVTPLKQVFFGNFDRLSIRINAIPWKIDAILQMNAKEVEIYHCEFTEKELNRLLKFWMNGVWPRLEKIKFCYNDELRLNEEKMLRGIDHQKAPSERKNVFLTQQGINNSVDGGWDIWRKDGTRATVKIERKEAKVYVSWYIWHPHCIGKEE